MEGEAHERGEQTDVHEESKGVRHHQRAREEMVVTVEAQHPAVAVPVAVPVITVTVAVAVAVKESLRERRVVAGGMRKAARRDSDLERELQQQQEQQVAHAAGIVAWKGLAHGAHQAREQRLVRLDREAAAPPAAVGWLQQDADNEERGSLEEEGEPKERVLDCGEDGVVPAIT